jgi:hypothetical protein
MSYEFFARFNFSLNLSPDLGGPEGLLFVRNFSQAAKSFWEFQEQKQNLRNFEKKIECQEFLGISGISRNFRNF